MRQYIELIASQWWLHKRIISHQIPEQVQHARARTCSCTVSFPVQSSGRSYQTVEQHYTHWSSECDCCSRTRRPKPNLLHSFISRNTLTPSFPAIVNLLFSPVSDHAACQTNGEILNSHSVTQLNTLQIWPWVCLDEQKLLSSCIVNFFYYKNYTIKRWI